MDNFKELIIEFFSEEIPARFQTSEIEQLEAMLKGSLDECGFAYRDLEINSTPRRLSATGYVSEFSETKMVEKKGPLVDAPQTAIDGFLKSLNASKSDCEEREIGGKKYLFFSKKLEAQKLVDCLPAIIEKILKNFKWPKSMRWKPSDFVWARPLRNVLCVFNRELVEFGIPEAGLTTNNRTIGHRFLGSQKWFEVSTIAEYKDGLRENFVILDRAERLKLIQDGLKKIESEKGISVDNKGNLLDEVVGLVEYPVLFIGEIPEEFMQLPPEILEVSMRVNQRYFCTKDKAGNFTKYFIFAANIPGTDGGKTIISGNQKVLCARLYDAKFFVENDKKSPLESKIPLLKKLTFQEELGSVFDKTERLMYIAEQLGYLSGNVDQLKRAAYLSKCDLKTEAVCEFPEVQGIMGAFYAKEQGESPYVYNAIYEQYYPLGDVMPKSEGGSLLSICDKLDSLVGFFAIGKMPTGSKDPFALRRAAIGILKIIKEKKFRIGNLEEILGRIYAKYCETLPQKSLAEDAPKKVYEFLEDRLKVILKAQEIRPEMLDVFGKYDLLTIMEAAEFLSKFLATSDGEKLLQAYKRAFSIKAPNSGRSADVSKLVSDAEKGLVSVLAEANLLLDSAGSVPEKIAVLSKISGSVLAFFDEVLINCENKEIRTERLNLVNDIAQTFERVGEFSKLI